MASAECGAQKGDPAGFVKGEKKKEIKYPGLFLWWVMGRKENRSMEQWEGRRELEVWQRMTGGGNL